MSDRFENVPGFRPLGPQQVQVTDMRLLPVVSVDCEPAKHPDFMGSAWLRVIDLPHATAYYIPMPEPMARGVIQSIARALGVTVTIETKKETDNNV